jgi:MoxR-like ATPase
MITIDIDLSRLPYKICQPDPTKYQLTKELKSAAKVAITLGQPLLLTGEPGTGKTQLAYKIAYDLSKNNPDFYEKPFVFNTKTTSTAMDLFYQYDAIRHFHDASVKKEAKGEVPSVLNYITFQALGKAIALSNIGKIGEKYRKCLLGSEKWDEKSKSNVVLIDEIDKAPRDFPNDLLDEIEYFRFRIKEDDNHEIRKGVDKKIIIVITSNSEKNLPDAFLRRCVFYHIPFPGKDDLINIVLSHLGENSKYTDENLIEYFLKIREILTKKKPATAELIAWLRILELESFITDEKINFDNLSEEQKNILKFSYSVLAKNREDWVNLNEFNL